jgi:hypothetical protein
MPTILLKKSDTPGSVPGTANLTNLAGGVEVAVNTADKRVYSMTSASAVIELGTNPSSLTCADVSATVFRSASATITNLIATSASITTLTNNPTFGAGTANGVLYLNGSKVATSGTALVFDGTNFSSTGPITANNSNSSAVALVVKGETGNGIRQNFIGQAASGQYNWQIGASNVAAGAFAIIPSTAADGTTFSTPAILATGTGNVGIGTASPAAKLHVSGQSRVADSSNAANYMTFGVGANAPFGNASISTTTAGLSIVAEGAGNMTFLNNGSEAMRIDTANNLGLGVTPSANTLGKSLDLVGNGGLWSYNNTVYLTDNAYFNSAWLYKTTNYASMYSSGASGTHQWLTAPSGTINTAISWTQAMTLDASGRLLVGDTTPRTVLNKTIELSSAGTSANQCSIFVNQYVAAGNAENTGYLTFQRSGSGTLGTNSIVASGDRLGMVRFSGANGTDYNSAAEIYAEVDGTPGASSDMPGRLVFATTSDGAGGTTERARITAGGYFKASNDGTYRNAAGVYHELRNSDGSNPTVFVTNSNASTPYGIAVEFTAAAPDNNTQFFFRAEDNVAIRCYIWADGDLANHDGVYGTISDERLKQDIVDASSQWDDLKAIRFRKYRMKTDVEANPDAPAMFGVVAQELAQVCPGLVDEHPNMKTVEVTDEEGNVTQTQEPDGTTTMTVKSSILLMKAAKALQEAMARIEQLEADMAALKASA